jgi:hypothetical protein
MFVLSTLALLLLSYDTLSAIDVKSMLRSDRVWTKTQSSYLISMFQQILDSLLKLVLKSFSILSQSLINPAPFSGSKPAVQQAYVDNRQIQNEGSLVLQFCSFVYG